MKNRLLHISLVVSLLMISAFFVYGQFLPDSIQIPTFNKALEEKRFEARLDNYHLEFFDDCKKNIRVEALRVVDSLLGIGSAPVDIDTFKLIGKPSRPDRPEYKYKVDTAEARRIFD